MIYAAGIDIGSTQTKGIILNYKLEIVARALTDTGAYVTRAAERCFVEALRISQVKREDVAYVWARVMAGTKSRSVTRKSPKSAAMRGVRVISFPAPAR